MSNLPKAAPAVKLVSDEKDIPVASYVKPLTYEEADAKIREGAESFSFKSIGDSLGRVDVVSLGTKIPFDDRWDVRVVKDSSGQETLYAGIYDGHNGDETSEVLRASLIPYVANALSTSPSSAHAERTITDAFVRLDKRILDNAQNALAAGHPAGTAELRTATGPAFGGSCALLVVYDPCSGNLRTACTGDSRAVRGQFIVQEERFVCDTLSEDQNLDNAAEFARIAAAHPGELEEGMDLGQFLRISTTRAFGNHRWKWSSDLVMQARSSCHGPRPFPQFKTPPYMTAEPEVTTRRTDTHDFVILGSDGLWEAISGEDAVECVTRWLAARRAGKPESVIEALESRYDVGEDGCLTRTVRQEDFCIDDLDNAAVCLLKNVLGGRHKYMVAGAVTAIPPISRGVRDDITVQVIFFKAP